MEAYVSDSKSYANVCFILRKRSDHADIESESYLFEDLFVNN